MIKNYIKKQLNYFTLLREVKNTPSTFKNKNCNLIINNFNLESTLNILENCSFGGLYIEPLSIHQKPIICLLETSKIDFLNLFIELISQNNLQMRYKTKGKYKQIAVLMFSVF